MSQQSRYGRRRPIPRTRKALVRYRYLSYGIGALNLLGGIILLDSLAGTPTGISPPPMLVGMAVLSVAIGLGFLGVGYASRRSKLAWGLGLVLFLWTILSGLLTIQVREIVGAASVLLGLLGLFFGWRGRGAVGTDAVTAAGGRSGPSRPSRGRSGREDQPGLTRAGGSRQSQDAAQVPQHQTGTNPADPPHAGSHSWQRGSHESQRESDN